MNISDLASIGSFISGIAVVISLFYLGLQIRQNTKHSQALIQQGRAARIADTAMRLAELRADDGIDKCFEGSTEVGPRDVARFLYLCRAVFISAEDSYFQHLRGLLDGVAFDSFEASIRAGLSAPGMGAAWRLTRDAYEPQFRSYMDHMAGDVTGTGTVRRGVENWIEALGPARDETLVSAE